MSTASTATILPLATLALLVACGAEPASNIAGTLAANHTSKFSAWSEPVSLGSPINTSFNDQQAALSKDGLSLYFASSRPGTTGPATIAPFSPCPMQGVS